MVYWVIPETTPGELRARWFDWASLLPENLNAQSVQRVYHSVLDTCDRIARWGCSQRERLAIALNIAHQTWVYKDDPIDPQTGRLQDILATADYTEKYGGDCDKLAVAFLGVLHLLGIPGKAIWVTLPPESPVNHVSVKAFDGSEWVWADPTLHGARVGESPFEAAERLSSAQRYKMGYGR